MKELRYFSGQYTEGCIPFQNMGTQRSFENLLSALGNPALMFDPCLGGSKQMLLEIVGSSTLDKAGVRRSLSDSGLASSPDQCACRIMEDIEKRCVQNGNRFVLECDFAALRYFAISGSKEKFVARRTQGMTIKGRPTYKMKTPIL